jgi:hypothetical protein
MEIRPVLVTGAKGTLAKQFGLTQEELDFVINYDVKHRMGQSEEESE